MTAELRASDGTSAEKTECLRPELGPGLGPELGPGLGPVTDSDWADVGEHHFICVK